MIFYATFMQKQATRDKYVRIIADKKDQAKIAMYTQFGGQFENVFTEKDYFTLSVEKHRTELFTIYVTVNPASYICEYSLTPKPTADIDFPQRQQADGN